jgi:NAD(P)H dehydrogenase (quinone)
MKIMVVLGHPDKKSFNYAVAETVVEALKTAGHEVAFHDLYREKFSPAIPAREIPRSAKLPQLVSRHCADIAAADGLIIVHPNWWGQPPAILKGWIDRVLRPGVAYSFAEGDKGDGELVGLLKAQVLLVFNTSNTPPEREMNLYHDPLDNLWRNNMLVSCGVKSYFRKNFGVIITSTLEQRRRWLAEARDIALKYFPPV